MKHFFIISRNEDESRRELIRRLTQYIQQKGGVCSCAHNPEDGRPGEIAVPEGTQCILTVGGDGKSAAQLVPAYKDTCLREYSEFARTQEECDEIAQNQLNSQAMDFVSGEGECVGIPELIPGRYLKIEGSDRYHINGLYFLTKVRHSFSAAGYTTSFEFKGAKL